METGFYFLATQFKILGNDTTTLFGISSDFVDVNAKDDTKVMMVYIVIWTDFLML